MKSSLHSRNRRAPGFTLVELLVVISIIGVLAGLLLPALAKAKIRAKEGTAKVEMSGLVAAIEQYRSDYSRFPVSSQAEKSTVANVCPDFTFGTVDAGGNRITTRDGLVKADIQNQGNNGYQNSNAEVIAILMALERDNNGNPTVNLNNARNPRKTVYLNPKRVNGNGPGGVGDDLVYRDPFGNPYLITMDLNYDDRCRDAFYRLASVSQDNGTRGFYGISSSGPGDLFEARTPVMVWSLGYDGIVDSSTKANAGANKDNLLNWK